MEKIIKLTGVLSALGEMPEPPEQLYMEGTLPPADIKLLAVVGSRKLSGYGKDCCEKLIEGLIGLPEVKVLDLGKSEARAGGELTGRLEKAGKKLSMGDALIAATAKVYKLTILTEDKKHFSRLTKFGIKVETV